MSRVAVALLVLLLGCTYFEPAPPRDTPRGDVWIDVTNRSSRPVDLGLSGQGDGGFSSLVSRVSGCDAVRFGGPMEERWEILVGGEVVVRSDDLPADVSAGDADIVIPIEIGADGEVTPWRGEPLGPAARGVGVPGCTPDS